MAAIPTFSLAERERRWARVRDAMRRANLEAIIGLPNSSHWDQFQADVRYLTQIGGNCTEAAVVFPLEGEVTAVLRGETDIAWWGLQQDWVRDMRPSRRAVALPIADRLKELELERGRIGVSGLEGMPRAPEGVVVWGVFERLRQELPGAELVNGTPAMQQARTVKSPDEIDFMRHASAVAEKAVARMLELARPGVPERRIYGAMLESMIENGGETPTMILWGAGRRPPWPHRMVTERVLQAGDVINNEIEGRWAGYIAQVVAPCTMGPVDATSKRMFNASAELFEELRSIMKPGVRLADVQARYLERVKAGGYDPGGALMHGRGLGDDYPLMWGNRPLEDESLLLEEGMTFILKPAVFPK
ncbi:MAG TPA: M24 family metallopeptidase, partial [Chloroflexota bacterium]|nr:M24 family metallopeptidase [Chloroflexota bacterium]